MTTPKTEDIIERAFAIHQKRNHNVSSIHPEVSELKESGIYEEARNELMRSEDNEYVSHIEKEAARLGLIDQEVELRKQLVPDSSMFDVEEALKSGCYVSGTTGSGKSDLAMKHAAKLMNAGVTVLVFDGTRDWLNRSSVPYYVTVRPTVPFRYCLNGKSIIFDMSLLNPTQQKELVKLVCKDLWNHQVAKGTHWYYLIFEEGHLYFPEGCMRSKQYADFVQLVTGGRNYKIRFEIVTQFSAMIDKNVMRYMRQRYCGYTDEPNDRDYVTNMLGKEYKDKLKSLKAGQFLYKMGATVKQIEIEEYQSATKPKTLQIPAMYSARKTETKTEEQLQQIATLSQIAAVIVFVATLISVIFSMA